MKTRRRASTKTTQESDPAANQAIRLPHERDLSSDQPATPPRRVIKRAHRDVEAGLVDTDERGVKARDAFEQVHGNEAEKDAGQDTVNVSKRRRKRP